MLCLNVTYHALFPVFGMRDGEIFWSLFIPLSKPTCLLYNGTIPAFLAFTE